MLTHEDVRLAAAGNTRAYARMVECCQSLVCSIALAVVRDVAASEEVAQEVFLALWIGLPKLRNHASFLPWLRQLTRNQANEYLRQQWRHRKQQPLDEMPELLDASPGVIERAVAQEQQSILNDALGEIPDESREVITLFYREGGSISQVAMLLGLREDAVKKRLSRGRERLQSAVESRFAETVKSSAPSAAFGAAVISHLGLAPSAQAAGLAIATAKASGPLRFGWFLFKGLGVGTGAAIVGVVLGMRVASRDAVDARERRGLRRFTIVQVTFVIATAVTTALRWPGDSLAFRVAPTLALNTVLFGSYIYWLPRIVARRTALERAKDPDAFDTTRRRHRIYAAVGMGVGLAGSALGFYFGARGLAH